MRRLRLANELPMWRGWALSGLFSAAVAAAALQGLASGPVRAEDSPAQEKQDPKAKDQQAEDQKKQDQLTNDEDKGAQEKKQITDEGISQAIEGRLRRDKSMPAHMVDVRTHGGIVTLSGSVDSVAAKLRATLLAESIRGVRSIVNTITVDAPSRGNQELLADVVDAIEGEPAVGKIAVEVNDGIVVLKGTVHSWAEKQIAEHVAGGIRGVKEVRDHLDIDYESDRSDSEVAADINGRLAWDTWVDEDAIKVTVHDGEVTLDGTIGSAAERTRAYGDAWVVGVKSVDVKNLKVDPSARTKMRREKSYTGKSDEEIEDAVRDAFRYDPRVASFKVEIDSTGGIVTLTGVVDNLKARLAASQDALNTVGVWVVRNYLRVRPAPRSGAGISKDILDAVGRDPYLERNDVSVHMSNGQATLMGSVDSSFEKARAADIAARTRGVTEVVNGLRVEPDELATYYAPYGYGYTSFGSTPSSKSDWEIAQDIESQMFWSPFVDSDKVAVSVDDGVATLTGTVEDWSERGAEIENAHEGGATRVVDHLRVRYGPSYSRH